MTLDIRGALVAGYENLLTSAGAVVVALFAVTQLLSQVVLQSQAMKVDFGTFPGTEEPLVVAGPLAVDLPLDVLVGLWLVATLATAASVVVGYRVMTTAEPPAGVPSSAFSGLLVPTVNVFVGLFVFGLAVGFGLVLLVVPGLFLLVSLLLFLPAIAVDGENFVGGMGRSWALAKGNRLDLFLLVFTVFVLNVVLSIVGALPVSLASFASPLAGELAGVLVSSAIGMYGLAVTADAYRQLDAAHDTRETAAEADDDPLADIDDELLP